MFRNILSIALLAAFLSLPLSTRAVAGSSNLDLLSFAVGEYDALDNEQAGEFVLEYRAKSMKWWHISPLAGIMATTDSAVYGFAGIDADFFVSDRFIINPNFAAGAYSNGDGKNLGRAIEFRSGIGLEYQFNDFSRLGLAINHISNAHLGDRNPGTESILVNYAIPVHQLFGR